MSNGGSSGASLLIFLLPVALIAFMVWSQRRRQRQTQSLQSGLAIGDQVMTTSGMFGTITAMDDAAVTIEAAPGVQLRFDRRAIGRVTPRTADDTAGAEDGVRADGAGTDTPPTDTPPAGTSDTRASDPSSTTE
jgi:preprotein translocase subunit YajC